MEVAIVVYDGFDDLDALGPHEVFSHATDHDNEIDVGLFTRDGTGTVETSHGLTIETCGPLPETPDILVVPGGGWLTTEPASARGEATRGDLPRAIAARYERGSVVASVCTGSMLLAACGLTDGRPAVTHHTATDDLRESGADVVDARVVDDGNLVTAGGITAGIDLALYLLERECDPAVAEEVARTMEYDLSSDIHCTD